MKLSQIAWREINSIYKSIIVHPFINSIFNGRLDESIFCFYIQQDYLYLENFSKALYNLSLKTNYINISMFLKEMSLKSIPDEKEYIGNLVTLLKGNIKTDRISPANQKYSQFLINTTTRKKFEYGLASVVPCSLIYNKVGIYLINNTTEENKYKNWISQYASKAFTKETKKIVQIMDFIAESSDNDIKEKMIDYFIKSAKLELKFWDDAYHLRTV